MNSDVEFLCEIYDLANPIWDGTVDEFRAAISVHRNLSAKRLLTQAQCLVRELIGHRVLFQLDIFSGKTVTIRNIDVCFGYEVDVLNYNLLDPNGLSLTYQIRNGRIYRV